MSENLFLIIIVSFTGIIFTIFIVTAITTIIDNRLTRVISSTHKKIKREDHWGISYLYPNGAIVEFKKYCWLPFRVNNRYVWFKSIIIEREASIECGSDGDTVCYYNKWNTLQFSLKHKRREKLKNIEKNIK